MLLMSFYIPYITCLRVAYTMPILCLRVFYLFSTPQNTLSLFLKITITLCLGFNRFQFRPKWKMNSCIVTVQIRHG